MHTLFSRTRDSNQTANCISQSFTSYHVPLWAPNQMSACVFTLPCVSIRGCLSSVLILINATKCMANQATHLTSALLRSCRRSEHHGYINEFSAGTPVQALQASSRGLLDAASAGAELEEVLNVVSPEGLRDALLKGRRNIEITAHLDLTTLPLRLNTGCEDGCDSPLPPLTSLTKSIRVRLLSHLSSHLRVLTPCAMPRSGVIEPAHIEHFRTVRFYLWMVVE